MMKIYVLLVCSMLLLISCKKESSTGFGVARFSLSYKVDNRPLFFDSLMYTNEVGEQYSVERLNYYLSYFRFYKNDIQQCLVDTVLFIDAADAGAPPIELKVPAGHYDSVAFFIGIDSAHNIQGKLPPSFQNNSMLWPESMGGGYHFLRLEGHWKDITTIQGYTMHIGSNTFLIKTGVQAMLHIEQNQVRPLTITMNINEWFRQPYAYSFNADGVYTMGIDSLMQKISKNGTNVFKAD